jgi:hypothetical protein
MHANNCRDKVVRHALRAENNRLARAMGHLLGRIMLNAWCWAADDSLLGCTLFMPPSLQQQ